MTVEELCKNIRDEIIRWKDINRNGCNDPFYSDGCNMNLVRNHIFYYKEQLEDMFKDSEEDLPEEYYLATPPKVDENYMANLKQKRRVAMIFHTGNVPVLKKNSYDEQQLSLF